MKLHDWQSRFEAWLADNHSGQDAAHDIFHFRRVWMTAQKLSTDATVDWLVVLTACYFHDLISLPKNHPERHCSSVLAAKETRRVLMCDFPDFPQQRLSARNDYRNKIEAGTVPFDRTSITNKGKTTYTDIYQWENIPKAVVEGLEGTLNVPVSETVNWTNNITYMLQSKNKETGERLSIIPEYTLNSTLSWQAREDLSLQSTFTWYGKQQPKKYDYQGKPVTGSSASEVSPYSIVGLSATWDVTKNVSLTGGVDNVFDKRLWREGNAQTTGDIVTGNYMAGAGANTYNEPGRTWFMSVNTHF